MFLSTFTFACSSSGSDGGASASANGSGSGTATSTASALSFAVASAVASYSVQSQNETADDGGAFVMQSNALDIVLGTKANTCTVAHTASQTELVVSLLQNPVVVGTYTASDTASSAPMQAAVEQMTLTAACDVAADAKATSGTVTVTAVSASEVSGTFDLVFPMGHLSGTFDAPICAGVRQLSDDAGPACTP